MKEGCKWTSNHDCRLCGVDCKVRESEFNPKQAIEECKISPSREKDEIDDWLEKECHIFMVSCFSIEELRYSVAREVAEKMRKRMLEKAFEWLRKESKYYVLFDSVGYRGFNEEGLVKGFQKAMKGE